MSRKDLEKRVNEVLIQKGIDIGDVFEIKPDRDSIDQFCEDLDISVLEKAYILDFDVDQIFNEQFIKGITILEMDSKFNNATFWRKVLNLETD